MPILFDKDTRIFTIHTENSTYQMQADRLGCMIHLYYGTKTQGFADWELTYTDRGFSGSPYDAGTDRTYSLDAFPAQGTGGCMMLQNSHKTSPHTQGVFSSLDIAR
ncbi:MAG: hypothetical protein IJS39_15955 [Synergistaceae bacterium]|nr:hypothetical protein [Synergistaceae bacterium]